MIANSNNVAEDKVEMAASPSKDALAALVLELRGTPPNPSRIDRFWSAVGKFLTLLAAFSSVLAILVGYRLKDRIELGMKEQELGVTSAAAMRDVELAALKDRSTEQEAVASALALATFGSRALPFLVQLSAVASPIQKLAARIGLRAVGIDERDKTCSYLSRVLDNRSRLYTWESMLMAAEVSADLSCAENNPSIVAFLALVERGPGSATEWARAVQNDPPLDQVATRAVLDRLRETIERLRPGLVGEGVSRECAHR